MPFLCWFFFLVIIERNFQNLKLICTFCGDLSSWAFLVVILAAWCWSAFCCGDSSCRALSVRNSLSLESILFFVVIYPFDLYCLLFYQHDVDAPFLRWFVLLIFVLGLSSCNYFSLQTLCLLKWWFMILSFLVSYYSSLESFFFFTCYRQTLLYFYPLISLFLDMKPLTRL